MLLIEDRCTLKLYDTSGFALQLKTLRLYRGFEHQNTVARAIRVSRQVFSLWELGRRLPTIKQLVLLANFFQINMGYFFTPNAVPEEFVFD